MVYHVNTPNKMKGIDNKDYPPNHSYLKDSIGSRREALIAG